MRPYFDVIIRIAEGGPEQEFTGLLDSGADDTVFPLCAAPAIGLNDLSQFDVETYNTANGLVQILKHEIQVCVLGQWHTWRVGFNEHLGLRPLLGRNDFFRAFKEIRFDDAGQKFYFLTKD
jgi:hypothetical protein